MQSPDEGSPVSTDSESSPPPEEVATQPANASHHLLSDFASQIQKSLQGSKRRLPGGSGFGGSSNRDHKTRRRGDHNRGAGASASSNTAAWAESTLDKGKPREERELVDTNLVDQLRKEIGDPFNEKDITKLS